MSSDRFNSGTAQPIISSSAPENGNANLLLAQKTVDRHYYSWDSSKRAWSKSVCGLSASTTYPFSTPSGVFDVSADDTVLARVKQADPSSFADLPVIKQEFMPAPASSSVPSLWESEIADPLLRRVEREIGVSIVERGLQSGSKVTAFGSLDFSSGMPPVLTIPTESASDPPFPFSWLPKSWRTLPSLFLVAQSRDQHIELLRSRARRWKFGFLILLAFIAVGIILPRLRRRSAKEAADAEIAEAAPESIEEPTSCAVCLTAKPDTIFLPCGHYALCYSCSGEVETCPVGSFL